MSGRKCGNCRHYEPSPIWRSGWCRNPRLYGPQESHLVRQEELACVHRLGNYWEPTEGEPGEPGGISGSLAGLIKPLRLFGPGLKPVTVTGGPSGGGPGRTEPAGVIPGGFAGGGGGAGLLSSSGAGGERGSGGGSGSGGSGGRPPGGEPGRPERSGRLPGQERIVSYQPEERYWSDYLRIALPVVGLLLMLGLFWFWAANLIGDDDNDDPPATIIAENETPAVTPSPTTVTVQGGNGNGTGSGTENATEPSLTEEADGAEPTDEPSGEDPTPTEEPEEEDPTPTEEPEDDSGFQEGDLVTVTSDNVNFRPEPTTNSVAIRAFQNGEELTVVSDETVEADGITWLQVEDSEGVVGWVAADFVSED